MAGGPGAAPGPQAPLQDVNPALLQDEYVFFLEFAATVIQRHWRGHRVRKAFYAQVGSESGASSSLSPHACLQLHSAPRGTLVLVVMCICVWEDSYLTSRSTGAGVRACATSVCCRGERSASTTTPSGGPS